jgi:glutamate dehydrogenase
MSGDVFGNGMLYTDTIRLVAAFDHRHVFLDPNPDPASRSRNASGCSSCRAHRGNDYDRSILSPAATSWIARRRASTRRRGPDRARDPPEAPAEMTPAELIRWVLKRPVDLLWNGGIGTYVKASEETNADAGDRTNDGCASNGRDLRAGRRRGREPRVHAARRIEYARSGGRINTDFIDNSAGRRHLRPRGQLEDPAGARDRAGELTLEDATRCSRRALPTSSQHVLYDNYLQAQILSQEEERRRSGSRRTRT